MTPPGMSPVAAVLWLSVVCGFVLKITGGYALSLLVTKFATSAAARFLVWLFFLLSSATFWVLCLLQVTRNSLAQAHAETPSVAIHPGLPVILSLPTVHLAGRLLGFASLCYPAVLLLLIGVSTWKRIQLARALRHRVQPPSLLSDVFRKLKEELQVPACNVWLLPGLASPASLGWARPAIYLPAEGVGSATALHDVLLHELSHVRRRDGLWDSTARLCRWLVFFHPLIHRAFAALRLERELACDLLVVQRNPAERDRYADTLVRFGWKTSIAELPDHMGVGFTSQAVILKARVTSILRGKQVYSKFSLAARAFLSTGACWGFATVAPLLWIAFGIPVIPSVVARPTPSTVSRPRHARRLSASKWTSERPAPRPEAAGIASPQPALPSVPHEPAPRGFHVQNADEPMSNPVVAVEDSGEPDPAGPPGRPQPRRPALPSGTSVLLNSAAELGRLARGRDHDRD